MANHCIVIGAGPVGLGSALVLSRHGFSVDVYEGRASLSTDIEESYPIGINPRTLKFLELINPALADTARHQGSLISAWQIFSGERMVANLPSGVVWGTTRAAVNQMLMDEVTQNSRNITIHFSHRLASLNLDRKELVFTVQDLSGESSVTVDASRSRIIAADGVFSRVRRALEQQLPDFRPTVTPWNTQFRVLFSSPDTPPPTLDPSVHYIFNGCYTAVVAQPDGRPLWTVVMSARKDDSPEECEVLLGRQWDEPAPKPTPTNHTTPLLPERVAKLRRIVAERAPSMVTCFNDNELQRFFDRRTFSGAVVSCPTLAPAGEWVLLIGDAAHSVFPATGEGINSGLEDCTFLDEVLRATTTTTGSSPSPAPADLFARYNTARLADAQGIASIAEYLNAAPEWTGERASRIAFTITRLLLKRIGVFGTTYEDLTFGARAAEMVPYRDVAALFNGRRAVILPCCRLCCFPITYLVYYPLRAVWWVVTSPCRLVSWLCSSRS
eukprot:gnl/Spiro4/27301_TR13589_c0_g1_i1.p1 gnl/Spiro4/27301_TR13589_c0_g1~~gnl/Spiro4/27301_TR13589_c0_g1_i1.p1  ORF type:complete len:511 (+),score=148.08 gnl/Spiro4/27301_TR13589_c0_g1_i1:40-1533(+)